MEQPVFILGSHKSGSSLLRSLLDGSPELFVIPMETHFFQHTGQWVDYAYKRADPAELSFEEFLENTRRAIINSNTKPESGRKSGDSYLAGCWNVDAYLDWMRTHAAEAYRRGDLRAVLDRYVEALHVSLYDQPPAARRYVEKSVEHAEFAGMIKKMYPGARFIHIVRNPYATVVAIRKFRRATGKYPLLASLFAALENNYYYLYRNPTQVDDYLILRYEDLVTRPEEAMRKVAGFAGIGYSDTLITPTALGENWSGNSMSGKDFNGISTAPLTAWRKQIYPLEVALVNQIFAHIQRDYRYERIPVEGSLYKPCPQERPSTYLANRFFWRQRTLERPTEKYQ